MSCKRPFLPPSPEWSQSPMAIASAAENVGGQLRKTSHSLCPSLSQPLHSTSKPITAISACAASQIAFKQEPFFSEVFENQPQRSAAQEQSSFGRTTSQMDYEQMSIMSPVDQDRMISSNLNGFPTLYSQPYAGPSAAIETNPHNYHLGMSPMLALNEMNNTYFYLNDAATDDALAARSIYGQSLMQILPSEFSRQPSPSPIAAYQPHSSNSPDSVNLATAGDHFVGEDTEDEIERNKDEPYAKLIFKCLLRAKNHRMVLKDIYAWFEKYTDKPSSGGKGWQNSIRHNLSMNAAFRKEEWINPEDGKRGYVWVLEQSAIDAGGVESTTRFRKSGTVTPARKPNQNYAGVRKTTARRGSRSKNNSPPNYEDCLIRAFEPTPDPEGNTMFDNINTISQRQHQQRYSNDGRDDMIHMASNTAAKTPTNMADTIMMRDDEFVLFDINTQLATRLQAQRGQDEHSFDSDGPFYQPYTPPSTVHSLAPTSPHTYFSSVSTSEDEGGPRVLILDKQVCRSGTHGLH